MQLYEILELIDHDYVIAVKREKEIELKTVWEHLGVYGGNEDIHCKEIEPDGYTSASGLTYLTLHAYDITDKVQQDEEELPFPEGEE